MNPTEIQTRASFRSIRYAQCWEDADVLIQALRIQPGDRVISIASAGDNSFSLLTQQPSKLIALDLNPAQQHCVRMRHALYQHADAATLRAWIGQNPESIRQGDPLKITRQFTSTLPTETRKFWENAADSLNQHGGGGAGKFERYFRLFKNGILPFIHSRKKVDRLLTPRDPEARAEFYKSEWNTLRWRWLFQLFFSRTMMGRLGRDPEFFKYVEGRVADRILQRTRHALEILDPSQNPYLHWILKAHLGPHVTHALRTENFPMIQKHLDAFEFRLETLENCLEREPDHSLDAFNLSDIFEYMSAEAHEKILKLILQKSRPGARIVYWNMLAPRSRPESLAAELIPNTELADQLFQQDQAWFYSALRIEEVQHP